MKLFSDSKIKPNDNDDIKIVKNLNNMDFSVSINNKIVGNVLGFETDATNYFKLDELLYEILPNEVIVELFKGVDEFNRHEEFLMLTLNMDTSVLPKLVKEKEQREELETQRKNMEGLCEIRRLLDEENIVTGHGEDCKHESFNYKIGFYPCPWDSRVLNGTDKQVDGGCYYSCGKNDEKILSNKDIYLKSVDKLISFLEDDPQWGSKSTKKEATLSNNDKKALNIWTKNKEKLKKIEFKKWEQHRKENEVKMIGCPLEFIKDLNNLYELGFLNNLGEDYQFMDDKIVYTYVDCFGFPEYMVNINTESIYFTMCPNQDNTALEINIGTGMTQRIDIELNDDNKDIVLCFWEKWKKFKEENPNLYNDKVYSVDYNNYNVDDILDDLDCELCLFNKHCNGLYCLKG